MPSSPFLNHTSCILGEKARSPETSPGAYLPPTSLAAVTMYFSFKARDYAFTTVISHGTPQCPSLHMTAPLVLLVTIGRQKGEEGGGRHFSRLATLSHLTLFFFLLGQWKERSCKSSYVQLRKSSGDVYCRMGPIP